MLLLLLVSAPVRAWQDYLTQLKAQTGFSDEGAWTKALLAKTVASLESAGFPVASADYDSVGKHVSVCFGKLTAEEFARLRREFCHPRLVDSLPSVRHEPDKEYCLRDFLEPRMQALANKRFFYMVDDRLTKAFDQTEILQTNCWSTAVDILNLESSRMLNMTLWEPKQVLPCLRDDSRSVEVGRRSGAVKQVALAGLPCSPDKLDSVLKPYDYFIISAADRDGLSLSHVGIYLAHGLVFQMSGVCTEIDSFHVNFLQNAMFSYTTSSSKFLVEYRRLLPGASMPSPQNTISMAAMGDKSVVDDVNVTAADLRILVNQNYTVIRIFEVQVESGADGRGAVVEPFLSKGIKRPIDM